MRRAERLPFAVATFFHGFVDNNTNGFAWLRAAAVGHVARKDPRMAARDAVGRFAIYANCGQGLSVAGVGDWAVISWRWEGGG